jgi:hypothetical protein
MSRYLNIEPGLRKSEYVGYACGVWRIRWIKPARGERYVVATHRETCQSLIGATLREISIKLDKIAAKGKLP